MTSESAWAYRAGVAERTLQTIREEYLPKLTDLDLTLHQELKTLLDTADTLKELPIP